MMHSTASTVVEKPDETCDPSARFRLGSVGEFQSSWAHVPTGQRYHFRRGRPDHQVQFAFQNHWRVFQRVMGEVTSGRVLEVGCGRGSMGAFFADNGFETHLLDTSAKALEIAKANFTADQLGGHYICGDALAMPYPDAAFDVIVSIGLLEHFSNIEAALTEQLRVIRPGGIFLGYVVPERKFSVQTLAAPLNWTLRASHRVGKLVTGYRDSAAPGKERLFRNDYCAADYLEILDRVGVATAGSFGMFPLPLVSHSHQFPFSPMSPGKERLLMAFWRAILGVRRLWRTDPWVCHERWGLAFLVWAKK